MRLATQVDVGADGLMVRLGINSDAPSDEIRDLQARIAEDFNNLDGFELREDSTMYTVRTHVGTESSDQYSPNS